MVAFWDAHDEWMEVDKVMEVSYYIYILSIPIVNIASYNIHM